jgi:prevent-host-death family protein
MTVLPLGDVKSHLSELVGRVHDHHEQVTVTVHGKPSAILITPEDLEAQEHTSRDHARCRDDEPPGLVRRGTGPRWARFR